MMPHRSRVGFLTLCERETLRVLKIWSQTIAAPVMTAMLYIGVFGVSLGSRIGSIDGVAYLAYIIPGVVLMQVATQSYSNNSASVFQGRSDRYIEDILSAPMHAWQIAVAILWGGTMRAVLVGILVVACAALFTDVDLQHPFLALMLLVLVSIQWGSIGTIAGIFARTFDHHMLIANLIITPLVFVGGVFYSVEMLPEALAWLTRLDPLFYQVNAVRHAFLGTSDSDFVLALAITAGLTAVAFGAQMALLVTGYRLKD